jgi:hypothetical protein
MSRFLTLIEKNDPSNETDPKWELVDFLKSKGIDGVSLIPNTNMLYINTGRSRIAVTVSKNEEDNQSINSELTNIASDPKDPNAKPAAAIINQKRALGPQVVRTAKQEVDALKKIVNTPKSPIIK